MLRRDFLKFVSLTAASICFGSSEINFNLHATMNGDLDDDLFIIKNSFVKNGFEMLECYQMHNLTGKFYLDGQQFKSIQIPGYIEFDKQFNCDDTELYTFVTANEREDRNGSKTLMMRSHYKSVNLNINNSEFFPSIIPEKNDIPNYPTWYGTSENSNYNYYQLWENASINVGVVVPNKGLYEFIMLDINDEVVTKNTHRISTQTSRLKLKDIRGVDVLKEHEFTELDGNVFSDSKPINDTLIRKNAIYKIIVKNQDKKVTTISLPYPLPYANRIFTKSLKG